MIKRLIQEIKDYLGFGHQREQDPVHECEVYLHEGCNHVDGFLCYMETCNILRKWREDRG